MKTKPNKFYALYARFKDGEREPVLCKKLVEVKRFSHGFMKMPDCLGIRIRKVVAK